MISFTSDVINANIPAMQSKETSVFNTAGGNQITINGLIELIKELTEKNINPIYEDIRPGDIKHSYADSSKAEKQFGYQSKYDIKDGLKKTIEWFGLYKI